jgi:GT2 family glycosyltransferase
MANDIEKIDIIIPNKSNISDLFKCLDSLKTYVDTKKYNIQTIIVDDLSKKSERAELLEGIKGYSSLNIYPIFLNKHYGFTKAINTALKYSLNKKQNAKPKYIAFLHNDTVILENWLENLIYQIEMDYNTFGVGSITINELDSQCITKNYEKINNHIDIDSYYETDNKVLSEIAQKTWDKDDNIEFTENDFKDKISLFSALFKIEAFEKYGVFEENLISSAKVENEFCNRLIKNDKKVRLNFNSLVKHTCRQLSCIENPNLLIYKKLLDATIFNMEIADSLNVNQYEYKQYVVYTYVPEDGELPKITEFDNNADYICFTDDEEVYGNRSRTYPWKIFYVGKISNALEFQKLNNCIKHFFQINPHLFFKNYRMSIWFDSDKINDIKQLVQEYTELINSKDFLLTLSSSKCDCSYKAIISEFKDEHIVKPIYDAILQLYRWYRYPQNNGFIDPTILIRKHNDERSILAMNKIWTYIFKYKLKETYFFNLVLWYFKFSYSSISNKLFYSKYTKLKGTK